MSNPTQNECELEFMSKLREMPPAEWVRDMIDHYHRTGTYRAKDLRRLLGDPNQAVEVGPNMSLPSLLSQRNG
jgi:hypothetical protein